MTLKVIKEYGKDDLAKVYVVELNDNSLIEFVESIQPPKTLQDKWVMVISSLVGCPVNCLICDAGGNYKRKLSKEELIAQIDCMIKIRFGDGKIDTNRLKIQFSRMGDPAFNLNVLDVLKELPDLYDVNIMPSISTIAPKGTDDFFDKLIDIKNEYYSNGKFQMQFSIHSTNVGHRNRLIPIEKWDLKKISEYGNRFYVGGDRKITLNFVMINNIAIDPNKIAEIFDPDKFIIKLTPLNPTKKSLSNDLFSSLNPYDENSVTGLVDRFKSFGFEVIVSIGEQEENKIGSNCGMYVNSVKCVLPLNS